MQKINYWTFLAMALIPLTAFDCLAQDVTPVKPPDYVPGQTPAYIRSWEALSPQTDPTLLLTGSTKAVRQTTQYVDGLGRPLQTVIKSGSLPTSGTSKDLVNAIVYDEFGREVRKYLPFAATDNSGNFKLDPFTQQAGFYPTQLLNQGETFFYSKTEFEASPLNRPLRTYAPGNSWVGGDRGTTINYWSNTLNDQVHSWTVTDQTGSWGSYNGTTLYDPNELYKTSSKDEAGNQMIEFKDKEGQVVLKKVQEKTTTTLDGGSGTGHADWLCTYYIYDAFNQLRAVIQPQGVRLLEANGWNMTALNNAILDEQCFRYEYDSRQRMIRKKVPGAGEVYMVYDVRDRLVYTQDANLRLNGQWLCNLYDALNRPIATALVSYNGSFTELTDLVATQTAGVTTIGVPVTPDLIIHGKLSGKIIASHSIIFEGEFETIRHNPFEAGIVAPATGAISPLLNNILVSRNPLPQISGVDILTNTFYDNYDWRHEYNDPLTATRNNSLDAHLLAPGGTFYAETPVQSAQLTGLVTGTRTKVLGTDQYLFSVPFYDDKGRVVQTQSTNVTTGTDIFTTQYSFNGRPLISIQRQEKKGASAELITTCTKLTYDDLWRVSKVEKKISHPQVNSGAMSDYVTIAESTYDQLGQLKSKSLGHKKDATGVYTTEALETLKYDYNVRGWLLGMNRDYAKDVDEDHYFGFDLGYDKKANGLINNLEYAAAQYNGNITGTVWKSKGDLEKRKYDFSYDPVNRLTAAESYEYGAFNFYKTVDDFTESGISYDPNGNLLTYTRKGSGFFSTPPIIDQLTYTYPNNQGTAYSNKLLKVSDANIGPKNGLYGDFKDAATGNQTDDYAYDANGNMILDNNKAISNIIYNHLNLPVLITITGKGTIAYQYDALGSKLKKTVTDNTLSTPKISTTQYLGSAVYQDDQLQFIGQEEGRIRLIASQSGHPAKLEYDYFVKDHLGNVRCVLTEEQKTNTYIATMETSNRNNETQLFNKVNETAVNKTDVPGGYPATDNTTDPNDFLSKLTGNGQKMGPTLLLKVMADDKIDIGVKYFYKDRTISQPLNFTSVLADVASVLANEMNTVALTKGSNAPSFWNLLSVPTITAFYNSTNQTPTNKPKATLNWMVFDNNFAFVENNRGSIMVNGSEEILTLAVNDIKIKKNGYLYLYLSNETDNWPVYFDNLAVSHHAGAILEETHYYPFGLTMAGISSKALGGMENRKKYNGIEFENDLDLNAYDAFYRELDPQIGRWWQIDPKIESMEAWSPYTSNYDNPVRYSDFLGDEPGDGDEPGTLHRLGTAILESGKQVLTAAAGAANSIVSNHLFGAGRVDVQNTGFTRGNAIAYQIGQKVGDAVSVAAGLIETGIGGGGEALSLGAATPVAVPLALEGISTITMGVVNLSNPIVYVNGNDKSDTRPQHNYDIKDTHNNNSVAKTGTSSGKETKAGVSYRGTSQANKWNKQGGTPGRYVSETTNRIPAGPTARQDALDYEKYRAIIFQGQLDPTKHKRP